MKCSICGAEIKGSYQEHMAVCGRVGTPAPKQIIDERWVEEQRKGVLPYIEGLRDKGKEAVIKDFVKAVCEAEDVSPPEVVVVPGDVILQISGGESRIGTYSHGMKTIFISSEKPYMWHVLHELKHHLEYERRGREVFEEIERYMTVELIPVYEWPMEKRARKYAKEGVVKYLDLWKRLVEPVVGKGKILPVKEPYMSPKPEELVKAIREAEKLLKVMKVADIIGELVRRGFTKEVAVKALTTLIGKWF